MNRIIQTLIIATFLSLTVFGCSSQSPLSITISPASPSISSGSTQQFTATGTYWFPWSRTKTRDITSSVTWTSGTTTVATINASGLVTAVAAGTSTITATINNVSASTNITVTSTPSPDAVKGIYVGGDFTTFDDGVSHNVGHIARIKSDGTLDSTFSPGSGFNSTIYAIAAQDDGKLLVGGDLTSYNDGSDHTVGKIARLNSDGTLDTKFNSSGTGFNDTIQSILVLSNGKIMAGGSFTTYNDGVSHNVGRIARLNADGTLDTTFNSAGTGFDADVWAIVSGDSGKLLVGGGFPSYTDSSAHNVGGVVRLNSDGTFDTTFNTGGSGCEPGEGVISIATQSNGKILLVGMIGNYNDASGDHLSNGMARLNADGTFDDSFIHGTAFDYMPFEIRVLENGKVLVTGMFTTYGDGSSHNVGQIIRLKDDGTFDATFNPSGTSFPIPDEFDPSFYAGPTNTQSDGKILVGGFFSTYNDGTDHLENDIVRLNSDGLIPALEKVQDLMAL